MKAKSEETKEDAPKGPGDKAQEAEVAEEGVKPIASMFGDAGVASLFGGAGVPAG
jgi:hypothetical protein